MRGGADEDDGVLASNPQERAQLSFLFCWFFFGGGDWFELLSVHKWPRRKHEQSQTEKEKKKKKTCGNKKQTK